MSTVFSDHLLTGDHASRPAASAVPQGTLYSCTDHSLVYKSDGASTWSTWATLGGTDANAIHDNVTGEIAAVTEKTTPVDADLILIEDSAASNAKKRVQVGNLPGVGGGAADHAAFTYLAAGLEPLAIEELQDGAFSYAVGSSETKLLLASFNTRLGSAGRYELRDPLHRIPLRDVTLTGLAADARAAFIDPTLPTYTDARDTYYDRINTLHTLPTKYIGLASANDLEIFLPGPYGSIITGMTWFEVTWMALRDPMNTSAFNLADEIGDAATDETRRGRQLLMPISKNIVGGVVLGAAGTGPLGGITYVICPSTWGAVADPNTYDFRDDFMGATLDTATEWTRTESTAGNFEINTAFAWCKARGDGTWGTDGSFSQTSKAVAASVIFECDVHIDPAASDAQSNIIVGFHDGAGHAFGDFAHGLYFTFSGSRRIQIFENGTSRGLVGPSPGWGPGGTYRVRITLDGAGGATYEVQGGSEHPPIGGATWTDVTPGTTSSATDPVHAGASTISAVNHYVGDVKIYS